MNFSASFDTCGASRGVLLVEICPVLRFFLKFSHGGVTYQLFYFIENEDHEHLCLFESWNNAVLMPKKRHFFFRFSTLLSNIFAPYIQNLEMCFAILVYFYFDYVWDRWYSEICWVGTMEALSKIDSTWDEDKKVLKCLHMSAWKE